MKKTQEKKEAEIWRRGYDAGVKTTMNQNSAALRIGNAVLNALDGRYEFKEEDY